MRLEEPAVVTVGSIRAGTKSNVIPDQAVIELNVRTYSDHPTLDTGIEAMVVAALAWLGEPPSGGSQGQG